MTARIITIDMDVLLWYHNRNKDMVHGLLSFAGINTRGLVRQNLLLQWIIMNTYQYILFFSIG